MPPEKENLAPQGPPPDSCVMVIFGATGDLTKRKLIPALCNLKEARLLCSEFAIVGTAIEDLNTEDFRRQLTDDVKALSEETVKPETWEWLRERIYYVGGDVQDAAFYPKLKEVVEGVRSQHGIEPNIFFYLATSPRFFSEVVRQLGTAGMSREEKDFWRRVIIEKPFGNDLESARVLNTEIKQVLEERQIYRIDHYLGKETVQNIMVFRFGNGVFEPIWNRRYIDHVQITAAETVGVERRGKYYESAGALRDMVPNHLFQLLTLTAMEPPVSFEADAVRGEQSKILEAMHKMEPEEVLSKTVRGQYGEGEIDGKRHPPYREEPDIDPHSNTETFVALKLLVDNWRWADVPFYIRTGKHLAKRVTEISIQFRRAPFILFRATPIEHLQSNQLIIHIQPDEGISLRFGAKIPGPIMSMGTVEMDFNYVDYFGQVPSTGYERLLYDCMIGDQTLFRRSDMVEQGWNLITPIMDVWKALPPRSFPNYAAGSWGPEDADELLKKDARSWRKIEG